MEKKNTRGEGIGTGIGIGIGIGTARYGTHIKL
jgi:hypothetical protein